ncbi:AGE family epimerase/isomerase [Spirosoma koreense]
MLDFQKLSATYHQALLRQVVPFWLKHSQDTQCGGYFDMLTATGDVIEGDKFVTMQAQQAWAFAWIYSTLDGQPAWLAHALHGASFLRQFAHPESAASYTQLDRRGRPVALASDTVPSSFSVMAYAQLYRATTDDEWATLAKKVFSELLSRRNAFIEETKLMRSDHRPTRHLSEPLALLKATQEMQPLLEEDDWKQQIDSIVQELLHEFVDRRTSTLREYILPDGAFINTPEGRRLNVGLIFQTAGYLFDLYADNAASVFKTNSAGFINRKLATQLVTWCLQICEQAWNESAGGLDQYVDLKRQPSVFPDWHQKWAWVQVEALAALLKGYAATRHPDCLRWFKRIHEYTFQHFPDPKNTGWQLALDQYAHPLLSAKAIPAVGGFSLIRCLAETAQLLIKCNQLRPVEPSSRAGLSLNP